MAKPAGRRSRQAQPRFRSSAQRARSAGAFVGSPRAYDDARPGYPGEVLDLLSGRQVVLDVGAGTGKLAAPLASRGHRVVGLDPSAEMAGFLRGSAGIPAVRARAEALPLADASVDAAACAQTWHWLQHPPPRPAAGPAGGARRGGAGEAAAGAERGPWPGHPAACRELDRVVRPGGVVVLAWNTIDVADPWVLRLARIMHSGDVLAEGFVPKTAGPWRVAETLRLRWAQEKTFADLVELTRTRSYWLRSGEEIRSRVESNLEWYFFEHTGLSEDEAVALPYRTDAFVLRRAAQ